MVSATNCKLTVCYTVLRATFYTVQGADHEYVNTCNSTDTSYYHPVCFSTTAMWELAVSKHHNR